MPESFAKMCSGIFIKGPKAQGYGKEKRTDYGRKYLQKQKTVIFLSSAGILVYRNLFVLSVHPEYHKQLHEYHAAGTAGKRL